MQAVGTARTEISIQDLSALIAAGLKGIIAVPAITEWGELHTPKTVSVWSEYVKHFGGYLDDVDDPLLLKRALDAGATLKISRIAHYTDITDSSTLDGVKATGTVGTDTDGIDFVAASIGAWGNKVTVAIADAANGVTNEVDYTISISSNPNLTQIITNVAIAPNAEQIAKFNNSSRIVKIAAVNGTPVTGSVTLTSGEQDRTAIVATDWLGDASTGTGFRAFDEDVDCTKIAIPSQANPAIDTALIAYVDDREDMIALLRTPVGLDGATAVDYREGSGAYSHAAHNSWRAIMTTGGLKITDPISGAVKIIPELPDVMGAMSKRDNNQREWFAAAGPKRGLIKNALGVVVNFGSSAKKSAANKLDVYGINPVINHSSFGLVFWGNSTLTKAPSLLKHANVAELMIFLFRSLKPLTEFETFDPNDIETWKQIHRRVTPLMDFVKDNRGIWDYRYQGDQDVDDVSQVAVNDPDNIDLGLYEFQLIVKPKVGMKYIGVKVGITNSGTDFSIFDPEN